MKNPEKFLFFFDYLLSLLIRITFQFIPSPSKVAKNDYTNEILCEGAEYHWQVVERILFVYSKLNPGVKYVQVTKFLAVFVHLTTKRYIYNGFIFAFCIFTTTSKRRRRQFSGTLLIGLF